MLKVSLEQWRMFAAVVKYGGFNQAASAIHKSQSSVHAAVSKLEQSLELKLFTIKGRRTELSDDGKLMLRRAQFVLDEATKLEAVAANLSEGLESHLRLAVDDIFPREPLYCALDKVCARFPLLNIEVFETVLSGATELMERNAIDMALSAFPPAGSQVIELCAVDFVAVASPHHPLHTQNSQALELEALKSHRQIVVRDSGQAQKDSGWLGANQRWTVSHMGSSIDMICRGLGYAWLPRSVITEQLANGTLKPLPLAQAHSRSAQMKLFFKDRDSLGPAAQALVDELLAAVPRAD